MDGERAVDAVWFAAVRARFNDVLVRAAREDLFVCVPQSCSLGLGAVTRADVEHHVLRRGAARGRFETLSGREVTITGLRVATGAGAWGARAEATVLSNQTVAVALPDGGAGKLHLYFLSRPLAGGHDAPARVDELSPQELATLRGFLRLAPEAEAPLEELRAGVRDLARRLAAEPPTREAAARWFGDLGRSRAERARGGAGGDAGAGAGAGAAAAAAAASDEEEDESPDLSECPFARALQALLDAAAEELLEGGALGGGAAGAGARAALQRQVLFALQAEACEELAAPVLALLRAALARETARVAGALRASAALSQVALGVKPSFVCDLRPAAALLARLAAARCPLAKLQALVRTAEALRGCLEGELYARGVDVADVDFGADDLLPLLAATLATAERAGEGAPERDAARDLPVHLAYIQACVHPTAGALQHSAFGYNLANFEQVLKWRPPKEGREEGRGV